MACKKGQSYVVEKIAGKFKYIPSISYIFCALLSIGNPRYMNGMTHYALVKMYGHLAVKVKKNVRGNYYVGSSLASLLKGNLW